MKSRLLFFAALSFASLFGGNRPPARTAQAESGRTVYLTLLPDYENKAIRFDGKIEPGAAPLDHANVTGLPLRVDRDWQDDGSPAWNILGMIDGGVVTFEQQEGLYALAFGPLDLQPGERVNFVLPYANLDYARIEPPPDEPDPADENLRQLTHRFSYRAEDGARRIDRIKIPFSPVRMQVDLVLTPLMGESLAGRLNGFRLSGNVRFDSFTDLKEFARYCRDTAQRLEHGDYRMAHLLSALNDPYYADSNGRSPAFGRKPDTLALRSELLTCRFDRQDRAASRVEAAFSGRADNSTDGENLLPPAVQDLVPRSGNYLFTPSRAHEGVDGYKIELGRIVLGPGDVLNVFLPYARLQVDSLAPVPDRLEYLDAAQELGQIKLTYLGPAAFDLTLPYLPETELYARQFPAVLRPSLNELVAPFGAFFPGPGSWPTWTLLLSGLLLAVLSRTAVKRRWLFGIACLLALTGLFYGLRGSFGLFGLAVVLFLSTSPNAGMTARRSLAALAGAGMIALAIYVDQAGEFVFRGLSGLDLSPLTPAVLMVLTGFLFILLYGRGGTRKTFTLADLPVLALFLAALSLYDALGKSLLALLILFASGLYLVRRAARSKGARARQSENRFGSDLRRRGKLVFGNRLVPVAILILMVFAIANDLSSTYANEMQVLLPPWIAPLVVPLLVFISVFITFSGIALLFVLVYPFLPTRTGYVKAAVFALLMFLVFFFGIGTDDRLILSLPDLLVGRVIYYLSVPMLIGVYLDIDELMQHENKRRGPEDKEKKRIGFRTASSLYFKDLQGMVGTLAGILSLAAPTVYAFLSSQPVIVTYFDLLEKLVLLPI